MNQTTRLLKSIGKPLVSNFTGIPKPNLTWQEVFGMNLEIHLGVQPSLCPTCNQELVEYNSDYLEIELSGQYMVNGVYCPDGHFTYLECA